MFWSYVELKNECSERLERAFFNFLQIFKWGSWNHILGNWGKALTYLNQNLVIGSFLENSFEATWSSIMNVLNVWKGQFSDFLKILSDEAETIFLESEAKRSKLLKYVSSIEDIKYCIKRHITSFEKCCKAPQESVTSNNFFRFQLGMVSVTYLLVFLLYGFASVFPFTVTVKVTVVMTLLQIPYQISQL